MPIVRRLLALPCLGLGGLFLLAGILAWQPVTMLVGIVLLCGGYGLWVGTDAPALLGLYGLAATLALLGRNQVDSGVTLAIATSLIYAVVRYRRHQRRHVAWLVSQGVTDKRVQKISNEFRRDLDKLEVQYKNIITKYASKLAKLKG